ncbi:hypothetical protein [Thermaerobacter litoralis]
MIPPAVVAAIVAAVEAEAGQGVRVRWIRPLGPAGTALAPGAAGPGWLPGAAGRAFLLGAAGAAGGSRFLLEAEAALAAGAPAWPRPWALAGRQELMAGAAALLARSRPPAGPPAAGPAGQAGRVPEVGLAGQAGRGPEAGRRQGGGRLDGQPAGRDDGRTRG